MRKKLIVGLVILNGLLGFALSHRPAVTQVIPTGLFDCCQSASEPYCCRGCCWFHWDCDEHSDCRVETESS